MTETFTEGHYSSLERECTSELFLLVGLVTGSGWETSPSSLPIYIYLGREGPGRETLFKPACSCKSISGRQNDTAGWVLLRKLHSLACSWTRPMPFTLLPRLKDGDPLSLPFQTWEVGFYFLELKTHPKPIVTPGIIHTNHMSPPKYLPRRHSRYCLLHLSCIIDFKWPSKGRFLFTTRKKLRL